MNEIDIILLTHNKLENTIRCVEALYQNAGVPFKLTVIDDSTDGLTPLYFQHLKNVNYVRPDVKIKSANQVLNIGLKLTQSDPFMFLGNSTFIEPEALPTALDFMKCEPKIGLVGFKVVSPNDGRLMDAGGFERNRLMNFEGGHRYNIVAEVPIIGWAAVVIRRATLPEEGLDEDYYIGFRGIDDTDNCLEIRKRGWKIVYMGLGVVLHQPESSEAKVVEGTMVNVSAMQRRMDGVENAERFKKKWGKSIKEMKAKFKEGG